MAEKRKPKAKTYKTPPEKPHRRVVAGPGPGQVGPPTFPMTRKHFLMDAEPFQIVVQGKKLLLPVKQFQSGSVGWFANQKIRTRVDGIDLVIQFNVMATCVGSKYAESGEDDDVLSS